MNFTIGEIAIIWYPKDGLVSGMDFSYLHGMECEIIEYAPQIIKDDFNHDYLVHILCGNDDELKYMMKSELRKKPQGEDGASHYDGTVVSSWDAEGTIWKPNQEPIEADPTIVPVDIPTKIE